MKKAFYATAFGAALSVLAPLGARAQTPPQPPQSPAPAAQAPQLPMQAPGIAKRPPNPRAMQRRDALEAQVLQRFVNRTSTEMQLDANARTQLANVVRKSAQRRKQLNMRTNALHRQFAAAISNQDTPPAQFTQMLTDHHALQKEEQQIADDEQNELQKFLNPRQQAQFLMLWIKLQENARAIQAQLPGAPDGPPTA